MSKLSTSNEWEVHFDTESCNLSAVATYKLSTPADRYKHQITNAPVNLGTAMNNDVLMINDDDKLLTTTFAMTKWTKPHP